MHIEKLVPLITTDLVAECREFYTRHFDCRVTFDSPGYVGLRFAGGNEIGFLRPDGDSDGPVHRGGAAIGLEVGDVDAEHARLQHAGVPIVRALQDNPWGDRSFMAVDPAGVGVYVHQPIPPAESYRQFLKA